MGGRPPSGNGRAQIALGLSILFAVAAFVYFALAGAPLYGAVIGVVVLAAGAWEYRRKLHHSRLADRFEGEAREQQRRDRQ